MSTRIPMDDTQHTLPTDTIAEQGAEVSFGGTEGYMVTEQMDAEQMNLELQSRLRQQAAVAELGQLALEGLSLQEVFDVAVVVLKNVLHVDTTKVLELLPGGSQMLLRAGVGWNEDVAVNKSTVDTGSNSQAGYTLRSQRPVVVKDLSKEKRFKGPLLLQDHNIQSGMSVIIHGKYGPYGVLGVHSKESRNFTQYDVHFLQSVANILAATVQRREAEQQLLENQERLALAHRAARIGSFEWNFLNDDLSWTEEMEELYGLEPGGFSGNSEDWVQLLHPDDQERVRKQTREAFDNHQRELGLEFRVVKSKSEVCWFALRARIYYSKDNEPIRMIGVNMDITSQKQAEMHKDEFLGIVSHELKTPVTSLKAYAQVLQRRFLQEGNPAGVQHMAKMDYQLNKLTLLIGDLLDVTKIESGRLNLNYETFDLDQLITETVEDLQPTTIQHTIVQEGSAGITLEADRDRLGQVLTNFISNAIKYSPAAKKILVRASVNGSYVTIGVQDFGVGIQPEDQDRIFERFFRVERPHKNSFPGIGLGLYISAEIVRRHNGRTWVESTEGKGSTFFVELPLQKANK